MSRGKIADAVRTNVLFFVWTYDVYHTFAVKQKALASNPCDAIFFAKEICGLVTHPTTLREGR